MKRYVCTVATGLLLALVSTGSAAAGLPLLGNTQDGSQSTSFGDQTVGEQKNDANVNQSQGNGNVNVSPAIADLRRRHDLERPGQRKHRPGGR